MASTIQIVPKYSYPGYIETVINDYTFQSDDAVTATEENDVRQAYAVRSPKGLDNTWIRKSSRESAVRTFGESNHKKYGQPLMQALEVVDQDNTSVWFMRVMPDDASRSNAYVNAYYLANDFDESGVDAHLATFDVKYKSVNDTNIGTTTIVRNTGASYTKTLKDGSINAWKNLSGATEVTDEDGNVKYMDGDFTVLPFLSIASYGRGKYGNNYSLRVSKNAAYERDYGIKMYTFEVDSFEKGVTVDAQYVGSLVTSINYKDNATLINDILDDAEKGLAPVEVKVTEESTDVIYEAYIEWATKWHKALGAELEIIDATDTVYDVVKDLYERTAEDVLPDQDEFDFLMGYEVNSNTVKHPGFHNITASPYTNIDNPVEVSFDTDSEGAVDYTLAFVQNAAGDEVVITPDGSTIYSAMDVATSTDVLYYYNQASEEYEEYDESVYDETCINFPQLKAIQLINGVDGAFDESNNANARKTAITKCYANAFNGTYDPKIFSKNRMGITVLFDAAYPYTAKQALYDLICIRDSNRGVIGLELPNGNFLTNLSEIPALVNAYSGFSDRLVSLELGSYETRERSTNKKVRVSTTFFEAIQYCNHLNGDNNGSFYIPFTDSHCELSGHIYDSLVPNIPEAGPLDINGKDAVKELRQSLDKYRFNFFECIAENVFRRASQTTSQKDYSDLSEENNVTILYTLKRNVERDIQGQKYNFADIDTRQTFIDTQKAVYAPWIGTVLESFDISFSTTAYEARRSILHVYIEVVFRGLTKVSIIEIDVNPRDYGDDLTALDTEV